MYFYSEKVCEKCNQNYSCYTSGDTMAKIRERTLPGWSKCGCGWNEISTSTFNSLVPDWQDIVRAESGEDDENESFEEAIEDLKNFVEKIAVL